MSKAELLLEEALTLSEHERAEIASRLLASLEPASHEKIDDAWGAEIERRCAAVDAGELVVSDWNDVRRRIERDIFGR